MTRACVFLDVNRGSRTPRRPRRQSGIQNSSSSSTSVGDPEQLVFLDVSRGSRNHQRPGPPRKARGRRKGTSRTTEMDCFGARAERFEDCERSVAGRISLGNCVFLELCSGIQNTSSSSTSVGDPEIIKDLDPRAKREGGVKERRGRRKWTASVPAQNVSRTANEVWQDVSPWGIVFSSSFARGSRTPRLPRRQSGIQKS